MPTPQELADTYSFIGPFLADKVLAPYGDNALPLFALGLYLDIEDLASFATDSLTDQPNDKKADVIYINEAEGVACIAQGLTSADWGKQEAPANKASDLNTAAAWLLQTPIEDVPETIRSHAKLLRDGLNAKTITRVTFAYAHNAMESRNVDDELQTLRHLASGLEITKEAEITVVELGMRQIEALHLTSLGSIQVGDQVEFESSEVISEVGPWWRAYVLPINGAVLYELYSKYQNALFSANLRDFLGARRVAGNVNNQIRNTVESDPGAFFVLNNGITLVTKRADRSDNGLQVHGLSVVNGAQTIGSIHAAGKNDAKNVTVLGRIIVVNDPAKIPLIVTGNNTQNSIVAWDRRSNDPVQIRIGQEFASKGIEYVHRRDSSRRPATSLFAEQVGQLLCAFGGDLQTAIRAKAEIFEADSTYAAVFPAGIGIGHIFSVQTLGWAYDRVKQELKAKVADGSATDIEQRQLKLIDYPASKQFLVRVVGELREEIAGRNVASPEAFQLREGCISPDWRTCDHRVG
ncbi:AIPR family protein [Candidatus Amarobacter glycogenicus]|uniref:AIPR family protein n=1 Tax=Candidatus Amarobacter glycogenicus TaxID=3140699 RepID=UPI003136454C|nr:AIPR family protein [Dehalococcoidia bacterium]